MIGGCVKNRKRPRITEILKTVQQQDQQRTAILTLDKHDIDLIFDMVAHDEVVIQPFLKLLNAPNQNLRRAHVAALKVKLEQIIRFAQESKPAKEK